MWKKFQNDNVEFPDEFYDEDYTRLYMKIQILFEVKSYCTGESVRGSSVSSGCCELGEEEANFLTCEVES